MSRKSAQKRAVRRPEAAREPRGGAAPSITPPVRTVVFPPSYGVTSVLDVSTNTRGTRLRGWRADEVLEPLDAELLIEESDAQDETEAELSSERKDGAALTTLERLLERECIEGRRGTRSWPCCPC